MSSDDEGSTKEHQLPQYCTQDSFNSQTSVLDNLRQYSHPFEPFERPRQYSPSEDASIATVRIDFRSGRTGTTPTQGTELSQEEQEAAAFAPVVTQADNQRDRMTEACENSELRGVYMNNFLDINWQEQVPSYKAKDLQDTQVLTAACIGLKANEEATARMLGDPGDNVYMSIQKKTSFFPTVAMLRKEIFDRISQKKMSLGERPSKVSQMKKDACISWLKMHPVGNKEDIAHILNKERVLYCAIQAALASKKAAASSQSANKAWSKMAPHLRMYCCFCDDEVRQLLPKKQEALTRAALDARNNSDRPENVFQAAARLFNSDKVYTTESLPDLHSAFADPIVLKFSDMPGPVTGEELKGRWADARAKVVQVS